MEWISVKDRLPRSHDNLNEDAEVIIQIIGESKPNVGTWQAHTNCFYKSDWQITTIQIPVEQVSHWMPLPEAPK